MTDRIELPFTCPPIITSSPSSEHEGVDLEKLLIEGHLVLEPVPKENICSARLIYGGNYLPIDDLKKVTIKDYDADTQEWVTGLFNNWRLHRTRYLGGVQKHLEGLSFTSGCCLGYRCFLSRRTSWASTPDDFAWGNGPTGSILSGGSNCTIRKPSEEKEFHLASSMGMAFYLGSTACPYIVTTLCYQARHPAILRTIPFEGHPINLATFNDSPHHFQFQGSSVVWIVLHTILSQFPWLFLRLPEHLQPRAPETEEPKGKETP